MFLFLETYIQQDSIRLGENNSWVRNGLSVLKGGWMCLQVELEGIFSLLLTLSRWGITSIIHTLRYVVLLIGIRELILSSLPPDLSQSDVSFVSQKSLSLLHEIHHAGEIVGAKLLLRFLQRVWPWLSVKTHSRHSSLLLALRPKINSMIHVLSNQCTAHHDFIQ